MKTFMFSLILAAASFQAMAAEPVIYKKRNAAAATQREGAKMNFGITSTVGQNRCELEGSAEPVDKDRYAFTVGDPKDMCTAVLNFSGGKLVVTTKGCESYCGLNAAGSMDGTYAK